MATISASHVANMNITSVKKLSESPNLDVIPSNYAYYHHHPDETAAAAAAIQDGDDHDQYSIPTIDLSLLTSDDPDIKSKAVQELRKACQDWGFFIVVNHGISEELIKGVIEVIGEFFNLPDEEKPEFEPKNVLEPIRYGTSFNTAKEKVFCWRDFLKVFVHPQFHCPRKPESLKELLVDYSDKSRQVVRKLLHAISESLGIEQSEMDQALSLGSTLQIFIANLYPRCPNPDVAMGMPPHSDHGLLTLLIENGVCGLQIQHDGKWINVNAPPNSILVNTGDHLEIFSNGKYKSVLHRAIVNSERTRISIAMANGPSLDSLVSPCPKLVDQSTEGSLPAAYVPMKYKDYLFAQQNNQLNGKGAILTTSKLQGH